MGTYSDDVVEFLFFGPDPDAVRECVRDAEERCKKKGTEIAGPIPRERIQLHESHPAFDDSDDADLFGQPPSDAEREALIGQHVSRRVLRVYNDAALVKEISAMDRPDDVFLRVVVDKRTHGSGGNRAPHSFDPATDYKTDP